MFAIPLVIGYMSYTSALSMAFYPAMFFKKAVEKSIVDYALAGTKK